MAYRDSRGRGLFGPQHTCAPGDQELLHAELLGATDVPGCIGSPRDFKNPPASLLLTKGKLLSHGKRWPQ